MSFEEIWMDDTKDKKHPDMEAGRINLIFYALNGTVPTMAT